MYERGNAGGKERDRKATSEHQMFDIAFFNSRRVVQKDSRKSSAHLDPHEVGLIVEVENI